MLQGLFLLVALLVAGESLATALPLPLPGSVLGMALLALALRRGLLAPARVRPAAALLTRHMALFFVPAATGVLEHGELLRREALPIVVAAVASTLAVMACAGRLLPTPEARP